MVAAVPHRATARPVEPDWPVELRLVVECLARGLGLGDGAAPHPVTGRGDSEPDWERFLFWVARHRVTPLVYAGSKKVGWVPDGVRVELRLQTQTNARRMLQLTGELVRILGALDERAIAALPIKGPLLALRVHGDLTMRQVRDLDLLLDVEDVDRAIGVLEAEGYALKGRRLDQLSPKRRRLYVAQSNQCLLVHPTTGSMVELHRSP